MNNIFNFEFYRKQLSIFKNYFILRFLIIIIHDLILVNSCLYLSYYLRLEYFYPFSEISKLFLLVNLLYCALFYFFKISYQYFRFFVAYSFKLYINFFITFFLIFGFFVIVDKSVYAPRSLIIIFPTLLFLVIIVNRLAISSFFKFISKRKNHKSIVLGLDLKNSNLLFNYTNVIIFIDKNNSTLNRSYNGIKVVRPKYLLDNLYKLSFEKIIISDDKLFDELKYYLRDYIYKNETLVEKISFLNNDIKKETYFDYNYYFNKESKSPQIKNHLNNKSILITGAGGSIGSAIVKQILPLNYKCLILIDNSEFNLFKISSEIDNLFDDFPKDIFIKLISFNDKKEISKIYKDFEIDVVFHAAAYKHVPLIEKNPFSAIKNNFFYSMDFLKITIDHKIPYVCIISSDKAVRPTNIMGASKRLVELGANYLNNKQNITKINSVRFGNVINSSGSVLPIFLNQVKKNNHITLTHKNITRFFMTIEEAASLVLSTYSLGKGGEIYLLDMGEPIRIYDLAKKIIQFSGKTLKIGNKGDIEIKIIGLRAGEKLYEELLVDNNSKPTNIDYIYQSVEKAIGSKEFEQLYEYIKDTYSWQDIEKLKTILGNEFINFKNI